MIVPIKDIIVGDRVREIYNTSSLESSMGRIGLLCPIVIDERRNLLAGLRRLLSAQRLGWDEIEVRVVTGVTTPLAEHQENMMRENWTWYEELASVKQLVNEFGSQRKAAEKLGVSKTTVTNSVSLYDECVKNPKLKECSTKNEARRVLKGSGKRRGEKGVYDTILAAISKYGLSEVIDAVRRAQEHLDTVNDIINIKSRRKNSADDRGPTTEERL